jgi:hypothetical protein
MSLVVSGAWRHWQKDFGERMSLLVDCTLLNGVRPYHDGCYGPKCVEIGVAVEIFKPSDTAVTLCIINQGVRKLRILSRVPSFA